MKSNIAQQKEKIRERYKGIDPNRVEFIPARKSPDFYDDENRRVAVYVRVSTDDPRQTSSFEIQKNYYDDMVNRHENWTLVDIFADEGISGTSLSHRDAFNRMIADCEAGKIDLIITKSVSRFSRNITDCIGIVRNLAEMKNPVGVFFETEHIFTLKEDSEMGLSFQATMAQEESHSKSRVMDKSLEMRFSHGILLTPPLLGYDTDDEGELIINDNESLTVRLIFFMYLFGYSTSQIAETLEELGRKTKKGNTTWSASSIIQILQNERYCGDVLARKSFTPNYLNHKSKKNKGQRNQYLWKDHHEAIVSRDDFISVQHLIQNAKYGSKGLLPELHVIDSGILKGFVPIHPKWASFDENDYRSASESVGLDTEKGSSTLETEEGMFDLRGFSVARTQFFNVAQRQSVTFYPDQIKFGNECLKRLGFCSHIEMLIHPERQLIAIKQADDKDRIAMRWAKTVGNKIVSRDISGAAFLNTLYALANWKQGYRYRVIGIHKQKKDDSFLLFDLKDAEVLIPSEVIHTNLEREDNLRNSIISYGSAQRVFGYPTEWGDGFGEDYYAVTNKTNLDSDMEWQVSSKGVVYRTNPDIGNATKPQELKDGIQYLIRDMRREAICDGIS